MLILTIVILIFFLILEILQTKSIVTPISYLMMTFILAFFIVNVNRFDWDLSLSKQFYIYVFTGIVSFCVGVWIIRLTKSSNIIQLGMANNVLFPARMMAFLSVFSTGIYLFLKLESYSLTGGIQTILRQIYDQVSQGDQGNFVQNQFLIITQSLAKLSLFEIFRRNIIKKEKYSKVLFIPILLFMICSLVSTDRNLLLRYFIYSTTMWSLFILNENSEYFYKKIIKLGKNGVVAGVSFLLIFYFYGLAKNYTSNLSRVIGMYIGSGLFNFNEYLKYSEYYELGMGKYTFSNLNNLVNLIFLNSSVNDLQLKNAQLFQHITFKSSTGYIFSSNIYSGFRLYVSDYGYWGVIVLPLIMGAFFEKLYGLLKKARTGYSWILYSSLIYSVIYMPIAEQFYQKIHLGTIYEIFWLTLLFFAIYGRYGLGRYKLVFK